jgi:hypothetical protein
MAVGLHDGLSSRTENIVAACPVAGSLARQAVTRGITIGDIVTHHRREEVW